MIGSVLVAALLAAPAAARGLILPSESASLAELEREARYGELQTALLAVRDRLRRAGKLSPPESSLTVGLIDRQRLLGAGSALEEAADLYLELEEPAKARSLYRKALDGKPSAWRKARILHGLACAAIQDNDEEARSYRQALARFEEAAALAHESSGLRALSYHGACFSGWHVWYYGGRDQEVFAKALSACGRALRQGPPAPIASDVYVTLGSMHADRGDAKLAELNYGEAVRVEPRNAVAHELLAWEFLDRGDIARAEGEQKTLAKLDPYLAGKLLEKIDAARRRSTGAPPPQP